MHANGGRSLQLLKESSLQGCALKYNWKNLGMFYYWGKVGHLGHIAQGLFNCKSWILHQTNTNNPKTHHVQETNKVTITNLFKLTECLTIACLTSARITLCRFMAFISPHGGSIMLAWTYFTRFNNYKLVETQISPLVYKEQYFQRCHKNLHNTLQSPRSSLCIQLETTSLFIVFIRMKLLLQRTRNTINNQRTLRDFFWNI